MGYLRTWSAYQTYLKRHPGEGAPDPMARFEALAREALSAGGSDPGAALLTYSIPVFMILAKEPVPL